MEECFTISGRIPSKKNGQIIAKTRMGQHFIVQNDKAKKWLKMAKLRFAELGLIRKMYKCDSVILKIYFPDNARADLTNKAETIMDAMVAGGVIFDDNHQSTGSVFLHGEIDRKNPRVEITLVVRDRGLK